MTDNPPLMTDELLDAIEARLKVIDGLQPLAAPHAAVSGPHVRRLLLHEVPWLVAQIRRQDRQLQVMAEIRREGERLTDALTELAGEMLGRREEGLYAEPAKVAQVLDRIEALVADPPSWWRARFTEADRG